MDLQVKGHVATVSSTLQYVNEEERPLEALFVFPMPAEAALCHFSAKIADKEVVAKVQEKEKVRKRNRVTRPAPFKIKACLLLVLFTTLL